MFRIKSIKLNCYNKKFREIKFENEISYIFAPNSKGKTLLCECIDFILGSSDKLFEKPSMEGVMSIEGLFIDGNYQLYLLRDNRGDFYYKKNEESKYFLINEQLYNDEITSTILKGNSSQIEDFNMVFNMTPSHRSMAFLNYLDQNGMGDLKNIFTKSSNEKYRWYYKDIIKFIFDKENIITTAEKLKELNEKNKILKQQEEKESKYEIKLKLLFNELKKIGIKVDSIKDAKQSLIMFEKKYVRPNLSSAQYDLKFLLVASQSLAEEIKIQKSYSEQNKIGISRQEGITKLLNTFVNIVNKDSETTQYVNPIMEIINDIKVKSNIYSAIDYKSVIKKLENEKKEIDEKIESLEKKLVKLDYKTTENSIAISKQLLLELENESKIFNIDKLKNEIEQLRKEIDVLKHSFDTSTQDIINEEITKLYMQLEKKCSFVKEDLKEGFAIHFDAKNSQILGEYKEIIDFGAGEKKELKRYYLPGSMARQTTWQILCYLSIIKYTINEKMGLPLLPVLILDNISMPYDNDKINNYKGIYDHIKKFAHENGIQVIITSNIKSSCVDEQTYIDLSMGLNPCYNKN